ncbi:MAG TPA: DUF86 domain-containing protein [Methylocystis sp.]|nr:DUF86 domain-containing protein [Methylocystis sp.]
MRQRNIFVILDQMLRACRAATSFVEGLQQEDFLADERTKQAVAMSLLIVGEAVTRLQRNHPEFLDQHRNLPWRDMVGMRNRVAHGYFDLNFPLIWDTVQNDLPNLLKGLETFYAESGQSYGEDLHP